MELRGGEVDPKLSRSYKLVETQEPIVHHTGEILEGRAEIHSFGNGFVQFPAVNETVYITLWKAFCAHEPKEPVIISPSGYVVGERYSKPIDKLHTDKEEFGGSYRVDQKTDKKICKHTGEDTRRYWLANSPEFLEELKEEGWIVFPGVKEVNEYEVARLNLEKGTKLFQRQMTISGLVKIMEKGIEQERYTDVRADLQELGKHLENCGFYYNPSSWSSTAFLQGTVKYAGKEFDLRIEDCLAMYEKREIPRREIHLPIVFGTEERDNSGLNKKAIARVLSLIDDYIKTNDPSPEMINHSRVGDRNDSRGVILEIGSKKIFDKGPNQDLELTLKRAMAISEFAQRAIGIEVQSLNGAEKGLYLQRARELGLELPIAKT